MLLQTLLRRAAIVPVLAVAASQAGAQTYLSGNAADFVSGSTLRGRNLRNNNPNGNAEIFIANTAGVLGTGTLRDSYEGTWLGSGDTRTYAFTMAYSAASNTFTYTLAQFTNGAVGSDNAASVGSSLTNGTFVVANVGSFNAFRLLTAQDGTLTSLTLNGAAYTGFNGVLDNGQSNFFSVSDAADFTIAGQFSVELVGNGVEGNRFEIGVASAVVPEPSTYALMGAGLLGTVGFVRRRRTQG